MTTLFCAAVGPVQEFISAARRTRDLWFGSFLLSEISKAVAAKLAATSGASLVFPAPLGPKDLTAGSDFNASNILLAELEEGVGAEELWPALKEAADGRWKELAAGAVKGLAGHWVVERRWKAQLEGVVEFYAAWLPVEGSYQETRGRLMGLMAARKACRDFGAWAGEFGVPKSSLDGARETVLAEMNGNAAEQRARAMKLRAGEQLDAVGLTKRLGGEQRQYPSVSRIAADPWLRGLSAEDRDRLAAECARLSGAGLTKLNGEKYLQYAEFPYEGAAVYEGRMEEAVEGAPDEAAETLAGLRAELERLNRKYGEAEPYLAILAADGDRMGGAISQIETPEKHREFSRALSEFAAEAGQIVAKHRGTLVYSGGDDVLALAPVDRAADCARALRDRFAKAMKDWPGQPTLSVGIAIGHMMEPLEDLLNYARAAEKVAKQEPKDALAVALHTRAGAPVVFRGQWKKDPDQQLTKYAGQWVRDAIPDKAAYELERVARFYQESKGAWRVEAMKAEARRILGRKAANDEAALADLLQEVEAVETVADLEGIARALLVARKIAAAGRQAGGRQ